MDARYELVTFAARVLSPDFRFGHVEDEEGSPRFEGDVPAELVGDETATPVAVERSAVKRNTRHHRRLQRRARTWVGHSRSRRRLGGTLCETDVARDLRRVSGNDRVRGHRRGYDRAGTYARVAAHDGPDLDAHTVTDLGPGEHAGTARHDDIRPDDRILGDTRERPGAIDFQ